MDCYIITNNINGKQYIGITIDFEQRIKQHKKQKSNSLIHKAIIKYGEENFTYDCVQTGLSIEEAEDLEKKLIKENNTLSPNGYNLAKGGLYGGTKNKLTDEQIKYIKDNRDKPEYLLYEEFSDIICYSYFKQIYKNKIRKDIVPTKEEYTDNLIFSCQFIKTKMTYQDIVDIRLAYKNHIFWEDVYPKYKDKISKSTFFDIYRGLRFKLIMPEVFTDENSKIIKSLRTSGENNNMAKLTEQDVISIRAMFNEGKSKKEISSIYNKVSYSTIFDVINRRT